jgi:RNA polymerase sigma factor (sigma-70 family)
MSAAGTHTIAGRAPGRANRTVAPMPPSTLDEIVRRYYAPLLSFFRKRTRDSAEVQDLVQQVFLRLSQHPHVGAIENPDAYVFQSASNALKDHYRQAGVRKRFVAAVRLQAGDGSPVESADFSTERVLLGQESMVELAAMLRQLPERTRDIFMMRCFEGLKHAEIARLYGISVRAVEKNVAKALAHLSHLAERGDG